MNKCQFLHEVIANLTEKYADLPALSDKYGNYFCTYKELNEQVKMFAAALQSFGVKKGFHIAQFSENSAKWFIVDQAIISVGGVNAIRGSQAPLSELEYIYNHSDSVALVCDNYEVIKYFANMQNSIHLDFVIYIGSKFINKKDVILNCPFFTFEEVLEKGKNLFYAPVEMNEDDVITLIYSSGTTGSPKGVMITHKNMVSQIRTISASLKFEDKQNVLSVLPIWHAYERACEYFILSVGSHMIYSNPKNFKNDLKKNKIKYVIAVPRLLESLYTGILQEIKNKTPFVKKMFDFLIRVSLLNKKATRVLNKKCIYKQKPNIFDKIVALLQKTITSPVHFFAFHKFYSKIQQQIGLTSIDILVSGGGALLPHVEDFFEAIEFNVQVGYGLTEASPVLAVRREKTSCKYSVGLPLEETEFLIVDVDSFRTLKRGEKGLVLAKGPQIMKGYYKNQKETEKVLLPNGFLITGDLGWLCDDGSLVLVGREKDIIVLSNGENVESNAIESVCLNSEFVEQIILTGQDKHSLSALIVPNLNILRQILKRDKIDLNFLNREQEIKTKVLQDLQNKIKNRVNYRAFERLSNICFIPECTVNNGLMTQTFKIKKNDVCEKYKQEIESMY